MIKKIENFTYKSFQNYSGPDEEFAPINIFFGCNGRGKSSLTYGIEEAFLKNYSKVEYRKFDRDYIENNLLVGESEQEVKGVKVSFGKNAQLDLKIQQLRQQIKDTQDINQKRNLSFENAKKSIDEIYKRKKKNLNIKRKNLKIDDIERIKKLYTDDYNKAVKQFNNFEDFSDLTELDDIENKIKQLPKELYIKSHMSTNISISYDYKEILESEYKNSDSIPRQEVLQWLEEGTHLHEEDDHICKFCGSPIDMKNIRLKIENYKRNKYQKVQKNIADSLSIFDELWKLLTKYEDYYNQYEITKEYISKERIDSLKELIASLAAILKKKEENISLYMDSSIFLSQLNELIEKLKQLESDINTAIKNERQNLYILQNNQEIFVKGKIAEEILNNQQINGYFEEIEKYKNDIDIINRENETIQNNINTLEEKMNDYGLFSELVNTILSDLNLGFKLCISDNKTDYF